MHSLRAKVPTGANRRPHRVSEARRPSSVHRAATGRHGPMRLRSASVVIYLPRYGDARQRVIRAVTASLSKMRSITQSGSGCSTVSRRRLPFGRHLKSRSPPFHSPSKMWPKSIKTPRCQVRVMTLPISSQRRTCSYGGPPTPLLPVPLRNYPTPRDPPHGSAKRSSPTPGEEKRQHAQRAATAFPEMDKSRVTAPAARPFGHGEWARSAGDPVFPTSGSFRGAAASLTAIG